MSPPIYFNEIAETESVAIKAKAIVCEHGIAIVQPQMDYIHQIKAMLDARSNRALGFPVLITQLCHLAGVDVTCSDPADRISLQPIVKEQMYAPGEKAK